MFFQDLIDCYPPVQVNYGASFIEYFAEEAKRIYGDIIPATLSDRRLLVLKQALRCYLFLCYLLPIAFTPFSVHFMIMMYIFSYGGLLSFCLEQVITLFNLCILLARLSWCISLISWHSAQGKEIKLVLAKIILIDLWSLTCHLDKCSFCSWWCHHILEDVTLLRSMYTYTSFSLQGTQNVVLANWLQQGK
jgi:hypothetical protein